VKSPSKEKYRVRERESELAKKVRVRINRELKKRGGKIDKRTERKGERESANKIKRRREEKDN
jgi:hypothetical protein